jgi:hypothetical protein
MSAVAPTESSVVAVPIVFDAPPTIEFNSVDCWLLPGKQKMKGTH